MQKDLFCTPIVSLLQCKKGFFAHLKLYFGSEKKPFGNMNGACDAAKTIKLTRRFSRIGFRFVTVFYCEYNICI